LPFECASYNDAFSSRLIEFFLEPESLSQIFYFKVADFPLHT